MHWEKKELFYMDKSKLDRYPSRHQFSTQAAFLPAYQYLYMDSGGEVEAQALEFQKIDEVLEDRDVGIFDTILSFSPIHQLRKRLDAFKDQGIDLQNVFQYYLYFFYPEQTLNFPYFIDCCASNYSSFERVTMDSTKSKITYPINATIF